MTQGENMNLNKLAIVTIIASFSTTAFSADTSLDSREERNDLIIKFDKNKDSILDTKELTELKSKRVKAHGVLVDYCKLLKSHPEKFQVKAAEMKNADGKPKPAWVCNEKRIATAAIKKWVEKKAEHAAASGSKSPPTRANVVKAIDLNKDKILDQAEAQKLLANHPKMHKGLMEFCIDVKKAPVKYGVTPKVVQTSSGKPQPGWACNHKRIGKEALSKWLITGHKP
jgi:hypothetical protein